MTRSNDLLQGTRPAYPQGTDHRPYARLRYRRSRPPALDNVLRVNQSALYPALHRLEHQAWIQAAWGESENNRRAKFYSLTKAGRARLKDEEKSWDRLSAAVHGVLKAV